MSVAVYIYDLTISIKAEETFSYVTYVPKFAELAKKWVFQLERGEETGYLHLQARISLFKKKRGSELKKLLVACGSPFDGAHYSVTSNNSCEDDRYCVKLDTRIDGPWKSTDENIKEILTPRYIPRQVRDIEALRPWQEYINKSINVWDSRIINCVINPSGNIGKSILISWMRAYGLARCLPPVNDTKDMLRMVCDMPKATCYMFDMPRSMNKDRLFQFYAAVETIKDGYAYDDRYSFKESVFDCPVIWIFMNKAPNKNLLSSERWNLWEVSDSQELDKYSDPLNTEEETR
jgi:hypothetical protein